MKKLSTVFLLFIIMNSQAQIGGGWDWAFNPGSLGSAVMRHLSYKPSGSIYFGGQALAAAKFGNATLTAAKVGRFPGTVRFFGNINAQTGVPTVVKWYANGNMSTDCITTDNDGNFIFGGNVTRGTTADFGDGITATADLNENLAYIAKMNSSGVVQWVKTFNFGVSGVAALQIYRLAVSNQGNIFFVGWNPNSPIQTNQLVFPVAKLDSNGNTVWIKEGGAGFQATATIYADKFVDNEENLQLIEYGTSRTYSFNGETFTAPLVSVGGAVYSHHLSLNTNGEKRFVNSYRGAVNNAVVDRNDNTVYFTATQYQSNSASLSSLPSTGLLPSTPYTGLVQINKDGTLLKASGMNGRGSLLNQSTFMPIGGGKLAMAQTLEKTLSYAVGVDYFHPADASNYAMAILETDENWLPVKMITGGKSPGTTFHETAALFANNGTNYVAAPVFGASFSSSTLTLPTTSFGTTTLTGFNAATDFATEYGVYSTSVAFRNDLAFVHTNSNNFPVIGSTTWLGKSATWNDGNNWSNGVPNNAIKAVFNNTTAIVPSTFPTAPASASVQVNTGAIITLPTSLVLTAGIKNDGKIIVTNAGFFQGFGAKNWTGSGEVEFTGTSAVTFFYSGLFSNAITINGSFSTFYNISTSGINFKGNAKFDMGGKVISVTNPATTAITAASASNYFYNGTLIRSVNANGQYEFPLGSSTKNQTASVNINSLTGVSTLAAKFTEGAISGTTPNTTYSSGAITSALNGGWFSITPDQQPTSGNYDAILKIQSSTNTSATVGNYIVIKRDSSTTPWTASGNYTLATLANGIITARINGLTSFSDFAIGIASTPITLSNTEFSKQLFTIYPNPATELVHLSFKTIVDNINVKIISITGQTVLEKQNLSGDNLSLDVSSLSNGTYVVQVKDGSSISTSKFVKK
jgi:Secretion system C-terminal sorting domain